MKRTKATHSSIDETVKSCPKCGVCFICKQNSIHLCHCSRIDISEELAAEIKSNYSDCLCESCLLQLKNDNKEK
jgi:hypothetical protein